MFFGYVFITFLVVISYSIVRVISGLILGTQDGEWGGDYASQDDSINPAERMYWGEGFMGDTMGSISTSD